MQLEEVILKISWPFAKMNPLEMVLFQEISFQTSQKVHENKGKEQNMPNSRKQQQ